jgi:hypothetical protein
MSKQWLSALNFAHAYDLIRQGRLPEAKTAREKAERMEREATEEKTEERSAA